MKTMIFTLGWMAFSSLFVPNANDLLPVKGAEITFEEEMFDFGTMKQHSDVSHKFIFTNTGDEPLIISDVVKTCGCTSPDWTKSPVAPGKSGYVTLKYDSKRVGPFTKSVTVKSNDKTHPDFILRFKGTIESVEESFAPVKKTEYVPVEK